MFTPLVRTVATALLALMVGVVLAGCGGANTTEPGGKPSELEDTRRRVEDLRAQNQDLRQQNQDLRQQNEDLRDELRRQEAACIDDDDAGDLPLITDGPLTVCADAPAIVLRTETRDEPPEDDLVRSFAAEGYEVIQGELCIQYRLAGATTEKCVPTMEWLHSDADVDPIFVDFVKSGNERRAATLECWRLAKVGELLPDCWAQ